MCFFEFSKIYSTKYIMNVLFNEFLIFGHFYILLKVLNSYFLTLKEIMHHI